MTSAAPDISIVIPTLREAANVPIVVERVANVLAGRSFEILIVDDDSHDGTAEVCAGLATRLPLRLLVRERPVAGLSGAVLEGLRAARGRWLVVMDADLQHPPDRIPALLAPLERGEARFTLGSRYVAGGGVAEAWGTFRRLNSRVATVLARPFAQGVRDPMSGFFALPREVFEGGTFIAPTGYKIALELIAKCRVGRVIEVPILFGLRERGQSKLSLREQFRYLEHLSRLYDFTYPRGVPAIKFLITVACAFVVASLVFAVARRWGVMSIPIGATIAYAVGIGSTALFHTRYVRAQREFLIRASPWADFGKSAVGELCAVIAAAIYLAARAERAHPFEVMAVAFGVGTVVRYLLRKELLMDVRGSRFRIAP